MTKSILTKIEKITNGFTKEASLTSITKAELENKRYAGQYVYEVIKKSKDLIWYRSRVTQNSVYFDRETYKVWIATVKI